MTVPGNVHKNVEIYVPDIARWWTLVHVRVHVSRFLEISKYSSQCYLVFIIYPGNFHHIYWFFIFFSIRFFFISSINMNSDSNSNFCLEKLYLGKKSFFWLRNWSQFILIFSLKSISGTNAIYFILSYGSQDRIFILHHFFSNSILDSNK